MENRWLGSIGFILLLVLLVFAVGYDSGSSPTSYGFFERFRVTGGPSEVRVAAFCGNRIVEGNEVCDDGNSISGDGCHNCRLSFTVRRTEPGAYGTGEAPSGRGDGAGGVGDRDDLEDEQSKFVGGSGFGALTIDATKLIVNPEFLLELRSSSPCETFTSNLTFYEATGRFVYVFLEDDELARSEVFRYEGDATGNDICADLGYNACVTLIYTNSDDSVYGSIASCGSTTLEDIEENSDVHIRDKPGISLSLTCCNF